MGWLFSRYTVQQTQMSAAGNNKQLLKKLKHDFWNYAEDDEEEIEHFRIEKKKF